MKRRMCIRIVRLFRSTCDVLMCLLSGLPIFGFLSRSYTLRGAVTNFRLRIAAIDFDQHGAVDLLAEGVFNGLQIQLGPSLVN